MRIQGSFSFTNSEHRDAVTIGYLTTPGYILMSDFSKYVYVQGASLVKTNQSLKISDVKIWSNLLRHVPVT